MFELTTKNKIILARLARVMVMIGRRAFGADNNARVRRGGILWDLDLREGIDFAIYLLGGFELRTIRFYKKIIRTGDTVFDIGANIGAHTLPFAQLVGSKGRVVAFEPTHYAFKKLERNLSLNPELALCVSAHQIALFENPLADLPAQIYSSWPLQPSTGLNSVHGGKLQGTQGARSGTLDQIVEKIRVNRVDFIKLDVDGYEPAVLLGAMGVIAKFRPRILIEWAPYLFEQEHNLMQQAILRLRDLGYRGRIAGSTKNFEIAKDSRIFFSRLANGASVNCLLEVVP